jgi:hypothetical protein
MGLGRDNRQVPRLRINDFRPRHAPFQLVPILDAAPSHLAKHQPPANGPLQQTKQSTGDSWRRYALLILPLSSTPSPQRPSPGTTILDPRICRLPLRVHHDPAPLELIAYPTYPVVGFAPFHPGGSSTNGTARRLPTPNANALCHSRQVSTCHGPRPASTVSRGPPSSKYGERQACTPTRDVLEQGSCMGRVPYSRLSRAHGHPYGQRGLDIRRLR